MIKSTPNVNEAWVGGKARELHLVAAFMPTNFELYVDLFGGGLSIPLGFGLQNAVINDKDKSLISLKFKVHMIDIKMYQI